MPLPADRYGTDGSSGSEALPAPGDSIDPALPPIAPADRVNAAAHVDPTTGERGVAFMLGNQAGDVYPDVGHDPCRRMGRDRPRWPSPRRPGPARHRVAEGRFAFTGDYTTVETERLRDFLQRPPMASPLRLVEDLEVPAS